MSLLPLILTLVTLYGLFLFVAYVLAKVFFPTINVEDPEIREKRQRNNRLMKRLAH